MVKNPAILQLIADFMSGRPPSNDVLDRRTTSIPEDKISIALGKPTMPGAEGLWALIRAINESSAKPTDLPVQLFPPNSELGRLQRRFGVAPATPRTPNRALR